MRPDNTMITSAYPRLFAPVTIGTMTLKNRVVMAPMESKLANDDGSVSDRSIAYYTARAEGGVGMVTVEFTCVDTTDGYGTLLPQYRLDAPEFIEGHAKLVRSLHASGSKACVQLSHAGRQAVEKNIGRQPVAPSAVFLRLTQTMPRALEPFEIERIIAAYASAAARACEAGYDAIMLHGAHGYLLTQFLSPFLNRREDEWGGDEARRMKFPLAVIRAVKAVIGDRPLLYRMSVDEFMPDGLTIADSERIVPHLVEAGVDAFDISIGTLDRHDLLVEDMSISEGWRLPMARRIRAASGVPVICAGVIRKPEMADQAIADGDIDVVSLGRALLADPEWPNKARAGRAAEIVPCTSCNWCISNIRTRGRVGCAENPRCGSETEPEIEAATPGARAVVVGAGPGGVAAALYLSEAGYAVDLYEARAFVGGGLVASATPPFKEKLFWYRDYLARRLSGSDVELHLGETASPDTIAALNPDALIIAAGAAPRRMEIDGFDRPSVGFALNLLMGDETLDNLDRERAVVVYGGGETGCETAEFVTATGRSAILVTRSGRDQLARDAEVRYRFNLLKRLANNPLLTIVDESRISRIDEDAVELTASDGSVTVRTCSRVLIGQGFDVNNRLRDALIAKGLSPIVIGDAREVGRIGDAVHAAYQAVRAMTQTPLIAA